MGHKKRKTKHFTFLLIPDNEKITRSIKISISLLRFLFACLIILTVLIVIGFSTYWTVAKVAIDYSNLFKENVRLKEGLAKLEGAQNDLERLKKFDQKLRSSLSGYVSVKQNDVEDDVSVKLKEFGDIKFDKSVYNFIPDICPVDGFVTLTRGFEINPMLNEAHLGIDIAGTKGSPIKATADGVVIFSGWTFEEGYVVIIKHRFDFHSFYKHNMQNLCHELQYVKKGQVIALLGDTGEISSGAHLHFEIWKNSKPVDPEKYVNLR